MIDESFDALSSQGPAWLWFGIAMRNGDMHHVCSLAEAFKAKHGDDLPIRLIVNTRPVEMVARIYEHHFASIDVAPWLQPLAEDWAEFFRRRGLPDFGPNVPIVLHPHRSPRTSTLNLFFAGNRIVWGQLYKNVLNLESDAEPSPPPVREDRTARALELLAANGMPRTRSMILFPYAQSFPVAAGGHFEQLARDAAAQGWSVFTSVAPGEEPVEGTKPVFIPFDILLEVAEEAGWVVAVRSGICDVTSTARCRKTFIFRHKVELPLWGVDALELARDAQQIVVAFEYITPEAFSERVLSGDRDEASLPPRVLSDVLIEELGREAVATTDFSSKLDAPPPPAHVRRRLQRRTSVERLINLPTRRHPRLAAAADTAVSDLIDRSAKGARFYACRDAERGLNFFEELDVLSLRAGRYSAADHWHTVVVTGRQGIQDLLPLKLRNKVLQLRVFELGHYQSLSNAFAKPPHLDLVNGDRPIDLSGLQLIKGWCDLEQWGIWSEGDKSVMKFSVAEPPRAPVTLEIQGRVLVTQKSGLLQLRVSVNGREVASLDAREHAFVDLRITIPPDLLTERTAYIEMSHPGARSPATLGDATDPRRMAFGVMSATLRHGV